MLGFLFRKRMIFFSGFVLWCPDLFSQTGAYEIHLHMGFDRLDRHRTIFSYVFFNGDTISKMTHYREDTLSQKGLVPGSYSVQLRDSADKKTTLVHEFIVRNDSVTRVYAYYSVSSHISRIDTSGEDYSDKTDIKIGIVYTDHSWFNENSPVINNFGINCMGGPSTAFSRHLAVLFGYNFGLSHSYFSRDSSLITLTSRKYERYTYLSMGYYAGIRLATHSLKKEKSKGLFLDLGGSWNFPLSFRHVAAYPGNTRIIHNQIHKFNDLRAFVHFGWVPVQITFECILTDMIEGDYPELPRYLFGINFSNSLF